MAFQSWGVKEQWSPRVDGMSGPSIEKTEGIVLPRIKMWWLLEFHEMAQLKMWYIFVRTSLLALLLSCNARMVGFIPSDPVSLPTADLLLRPLCLIVSDMKDTMRIVENRTVVHDLQRTTTFALEKAFEASFPMGRTEDAKNCIMLRMVSVSIGYRPLKHFQPGPGDIYPQKQVDVKYKALLYDAGVLIAVFDNVVSHPGSPPFRKELKKGIELMAEDLNAKVVRFMLGQKDE